MTVLYQRPDAILFLKSSPMAAATAIVASTLLGSNPILIGSELKYTLSIPQRSVILLSENQVAKLSGLRIKGFSGAVLVISRCSLSTLKKKYQILRWGEGSHEVCEPDAGLKLLLPIIIELVPLEPENLNLLRKELKLIPGKILKQQVFPCLQRLQSQDNHTLKELDTLAKLVENLRSQTPCACHRVVEVAGHRTQIQQHFRSYIEKLRVCEINNQEANTNLGEIIVSLRQVFEQWRSAVQISGEMLEPMG